MSVGVCVLLTLARQLRATTLNVYIVLSFLFTAGICCLVISGGDWMAGGRFFAHFLPVAIAFVPWALDGLRSRRSVLPAATLVLLALEATSIMTFVGKFSTSAPLWSRIPGREGPERQYSWFERHSRINLRDMRLIQRLDDVVAHLASRKSTPVIVLSGQMGMVPYHIAMRHFGRVRFVDRHGLIERSLTTCDSTRNLPRDTGGLIFNFGRYFENLAELQQNCRLGRPDVIFDIGSFHSSRIAAYGYREVYIQTGEVTAHNTHFAGLRVRADAFVAVDESLVDLSGSAAVTGSRSRPQREP